MTQYLPPWENAPAQQFLESFIPYRNILLQIEKTLHLDPRTHSHELRAAAAMVILLCRDGLWPAKGGVEKRDEIVHLATVKLTRIKQLYEQKSKVNPDLLSDPRYRQLMNSLDHEIRILESRLSDPKPQMPKEPPITWGDFWMTNQR